MKKVFLALLLVAGMIPLASHAVCTLGGHVVRVTAYNDGVGVYHYIYFRTSALSNIYWLARTSDDEMAVIATTALANTTRVIIQSDAASCPTSGYIGNLQYLVVNP